MDTLISQLLDLPDRVHKGDFVLNLSEGVTPDKAARTLDEYVVTPQLADCFDNALGFIKSAIEAKSSKAAYLHGSFGSGKSHFMAVLHLLLQHNEDARAITELAPICVKHAWAQGKKFLLVPYHMIGARNMESAILGGYAEHARKLHPEAPWPGIYLADDVFADARRYRENVGDDKFFTLISQGAGGSKWGAMRRGWTAESFAAAMAADPGDDARGRLVGDLIKHLFPAYQGVASGRGSHDFLSLDKGLSVLSRHARDLGYDALILFLDELILWLASHAAQPAFVHQEGQKLAKLVESQQSDRPIPIVSFVARQRDLRDLVGANMPGAAQLSFADALKHWEGRFHMITLEDRNLPVIAERRVLKPRDKACGTELKHAFEQAIRVKPEVLETLLTHEADLEMFRKVYPFSPALVQTLVAVSSVLQRERTALKIMLQLLVAKRDTLRVGELIPVGDLWDMVAHGEEAFSDVMRANFENARKLYHNKLRPLLEEVNGVNVEHDRGRTASDPELARRLQRYDNDDRLVKSLLLAALVPAVEPLKNLTPMRLAALNHGTIKAPPGASEARVVLNKLRTWAARVGEIRISDESANPVISLQVVGVDTDAIVAKGKSFDNTGNRIRKVRELLFEAMGVPVRDEMFQTHEFVWRGSRRRCDVLYANVRELPDESLRAPAGDDEWKVIVDWPFDDPTHTPTEDWDRLRRFGDQHEGTRTIVWLPSFFAIATQSELGKLVIIDNLLRGDNLDQYASHLSAQDRLSARLLLENQQSALTGANRLALNAAYGIVHQVPSGVLDAASAAEGHFCSLWPGFTPQKPVATDLHGALEHLLGQALESQYPDHPHFEREVGGAVLRKALEEVQRAARTDGRVEVEKPRRPDVRLVVNPLGLANMTEQYLVLGTDWRNHFNKQLAVEGEITPTVAKLREWMDKPRARGLLREVGNLLILAFAEQTNRAFYRNGRPVEVSLDNIPPDVELRLQDLPSDDEWEAAKGRATAIFEVASPGASLRTAANVAALAGKLLAAADTHGKACQELAGEVRLGLAQMGVPEDEIRQAPRHRTASAVDALLSGLSGKEATAAVQHLAAVRLDTSAAAMAQSLKKAAAVLGALKGTNWGLLQGVARLDDERKPGADELIAGVRKALAADEYHTALGPALAGAVDTAVEILSPPRRRGGDGGGGGGGGDRPPKRTGREFVEDGTIEVDASSWQAAADKLAAKLGGGDGRLKLTLRWTLEREVPR